MNRLLLVPLLLTSLAATPAGAQPLLDPWTGPYYGVPPFQKIQPAQFPQAFGTAMSQYRAELQRIAGQEAPPTFENTLAALENSGRLYNRVNVLFGIYTSTMNSPQVQAIEREWRPRFAAFDDEIIQNERLFRRIDRLYHSPQKSEWSPEQQRLAHVYYQRFVRSGARLKPAQKRQLSQYNQQLAKLYTRFSQNVLADEEKQFLVVTPEEAEGLPESLRQSAVQAASEKGLTGKLLIRNTRSAVEPFLTYASRRAIREKAWRMWTRRGDSGGATDNNAVIADIVRLRTQRARLLGFASYAHWKLGDSMAGTPERALELMMKVWPSAVARVQQEVKDMQAVAQQAGDNLQLEPWDYRFYAEKVRKARYDLDENEIKPYFQLDKLQQGLFYMAEQLYGFHFSPVQGLPRIHPDVSVYEVKDRAGKHVGLWYFDPYARNGKSSGAWMNEYRTQEKFKRPVPPIVSNNSNFLKAAAGAPVLLSFDDAETMFHEFGHALHGLNSRVRYPSLAGTNVCRDFVEFPSQFHEHYLTTPEVLSRFALHYQTGQPMPAALVEKIERASTFNSGFATVEYLASAIVDMKLHLAKEGRVDAREFEKTTLAELGMPPQMVMRHRLPHFNHLFSDDGYAAGYYSYLWSEVLDHDAYEAFLEAGGPWDPKLARRFRETIMQAGNTLDPAQAYRNFRGRDASIVPYLKDRGFPLP